MTVAIHAALAVAEIVVTKRIPVIDSFFLERLTRI
jgi:hypothetical protein